MRESRSNVVESQQGRCMGDEELASGTSSAGHVLASLWLEPLVSQGSQEVFLVPPPTPTYLLRLHIYISAFVHHFNNGVVVLGCCFPTTVRFSPVKMRGFHSTSTREIQLCARPADVFPPAVGKSRTPVYCTCEKI